MPKKKERPRSREEQERAFKEAAKASEADETGKAFDAAMKKIASAKLTPKKK